MFENIGNKIKGLAKVLCCLEIIASIIVGIMVIIVSDGDLAELGLAIIVFGPLLSWISSFFLVAIGETILQLTRIADNTAAIAKKNTQPVAVEKTNENTNQTSFQSKTTEENTNISKTPCCELCLASDVKLYTAVDSDGKNRVVCEACASALRLHIPKSTDAEN